MNLDDIFPEQRAQEAADKARLDRLEALLTPPLTERDMALLEEAERVERSWRRRKGLEPYPPIRSGLRSSSEIAAEGKAAHWPGSLRSEYLAAIEREKVTTRASRSYGGAT